MNIEEEAREIATTHGGWTLPEDEDRLAAYIAAAITQALKAAANERERLREALRKARPYVDQRNTPARRDFLAQIDALLGENG